MGMALLLSPRPVLIDLAYDTNLLTYLHLSCCGHCCELPVMILMAMELL